MTQVRGYRCCWRFDKDRERGREEWEELRTRILRALDRFPEARAAFVAALAGEEAR